MIVDLLEPYYAKRAAPNRPINVFRASSSGYCERRLGYDLLGFEGDPITPRRAAVFQHGNIIDAALKADLAEVLGDRFINLDTLGVNECYIEGVRVTFTPDGAFQTDDGEIGIIEIKTMSDWAFERALKGEIDRAYLCQAWTYAYGTSFNPVVFICYRKQTSHFCEIVFNRNVTELVVTQRCGGDPKEIYVNDPLLISEITTPFDPSVEEEVRGKFKRLAQVIFEADLAPGVRVVEPEMVNIQGNGPASAWADANNVPMSTAVKSGSWYKFATGRTIANFPCSYCHMIKRCLGARLEIEGGKPKWVIEGPAKDTAIAVTDIK